MAVPYFEVAMGPALQWVSTPSPSFRRLRPCSEMAVHMAISSSKMAWHSARRTLRSPPLRSAASVMRRRAQLRFTAVGREELR